MMTRFKATTRRDGATLALISLAAGFTAATAVPDQAGFSVTETPGGVVVNYNGELLTRYVIGEANKSYLWPVIGPTGVPITRAFPMEEIDGEKQDHPHHRSIWFGHQHLNGFNTWHELKSFEGSKNKNPEKFEKELAELGSSVHREFLKLSGDKEKAVIAVANDCVDSSGKKFMEDESTITFRVDGDTRIIDFDIDLIASEGPVTLDEAKDAGFSVRVATSMDVESKPGGRIINSEGDTDKDAWSKAAKWCEYDGPLDGETVGVAILNHPSSFRHPTTWHVRTYGLFTANPFMGDERAGGYGGGGVTLAKGERIKLRHRIILHKGDEKTADIEGAYAAYAKEKK